MHLLVSVLETDGYVVGSNNGPSGLHTFEDGTWSHRGWKNVRAFSVAQHRETILLAAGNGILQTHDAGASWRVASDWRLTEALDILPPVDRGRHMIATAHGAWTWDGGADWRRANNGLATTFVSALHALPSGRTLAATELGLAVFDPTRETWQHLGPATPVRSLSTRGSLCLAGAEQTGLHVSHDGGSTWLRTISDESVYAVAVRPDSNTVVAGGLSGTIWVSETAGLSWDRVPHPAQQRVDDAIHSLAFSSDGNTLFCGCGKSGLYVLDARTMQIIDRALDRAFVSRVLPTA